MTESDWCFWEKSIHKKPDQKNRLYSATKAENTPLSIDRENMTGIFSGSHGEYNVTLNSCTCIDFSRRKLPCKHIYRLAAELEVINLRVESDISAVKKKPADYDEKQRLKRDGLSLNHTIIILEDLPDEEQILLKEIIYETLYNEKRKLIGFRDKHSQLSEIAKNSLINIVEDDKTAFGTLGRNELRKRLVASGIDDFNKNMKLDNLVSFCLENNIDKNKIAPDVTVVTLSPILEKSKYKLYRYLIRKYDDDAYWDVDDSMMIIPKGSHLVNTLSQKDGAKSFLAFPDDEITELLNEYGKNRCHK